jgi:hypothetical protein
MGVELILNMLCISNIPQTIDSVQHYIDVRHSCCTVIITVAMVMLLSSFRPYGIMKATDIGPVLSLMLFLNKRTVIHGSH